MQSLVPHPNAVYKNLIDAARSIVNNEGIMAAFRGMNIVALGAGPAHAMYFSCYEAVKKHVNKNSSNSAFGHGKVFDVWVKFGHNCQMPLKL